VELTGFSSPNFQTIIDSLRRLHQMLARQVPEGAMEQYTFGHANGFDTIQLSTRYFTPRRDDPANPQVPFDRLVDPKGILASLSNEAYFHGEDNKVLYYMLKSDGEKGEPR
jgi:hypothetical protein